MTRTTRAIVVCIVLTLSSLAHAQDAPGIGVPPDQRALSDILSKYNGLDAAAPNRIQQDRIAEAFKKEFCAHIPTGDVTGWIGEISSVDYHGPDKSIRIDMGVNIFDLDSGSYGVELSLGNYYAYGITAANTQPHSPTEIPVGSPLYEMAANLRSGDTIRFNAAFIPYISDAACYDQRGYTTRFAVVRFNSLQKIGWGLHLN
jgi:hypothetical protein